MEYEELLERYFETLDAVQALLDLVSRREKELNTIYGRIEYLEEELERKEKIIDVLKGSRSKPLFDREGNLNLKKVSKQSPRALVVEPVPRMRLILKEIINSAGFIVVGEAQDIKSSLTVAKHSKPELVVLNARLGHENGLEALKELRKLQPNLKAIIITDGPDPIAVLSALEEGVADIIPKPINRLRLHELVKSLVPL